MNEHTILRKMAEAICEDIREYPLKNAIRSDDLAAEFTTVLARVLAESNATIQDRPAGEAQPIGDEDKESQMNDAIQLIIKERENQITHGYNSKHDDGHSDGSLADLAAWLIGARIALPEWAQDYARHIEEKFQHNEIHKLIIAAALIAAEIERLQRAALSHQPQEAR